MGVSFFLFLFCGVSYAQILSGKININAKGISFQDFIAAFESQTATHVYYDASLIPEQKTFDIYYNNWKAKAALSDFLQKNGLTYSQNGSNIILRRYIPPKSNANAVLSGIVSQKGSGEVLIGAYLEIQGSSVYSFTNNSGYFSLSLPVGNAIIKISYPGFQSIYDTLSADRSYFRKYVLEIKDSIGMALIYANSNNKGSIIQGNLDHHYIPKTKIQFLPSLLGEPDVLKAFSMFPGVVSGSEGMLGIFVRGGGADQNLTLLNGMPLFNSYHLYGIFSVFNEDIVKDATLMKGGFPAAYSGRLSSVLSIHTRDGNAEKIRGSISTGLIASKIMLEGPIIKNKTTFVVSFRRSYIDLLANQAAKWVLENDSLENTVYYFYDINARITHRFNPRSRLSFTYYRGLDVSGVSDKSYSDEGNQTVREKRSQLASWGNQLAGVVWNYSAATRYHMEWSAHITSYNYSFTQRYELKKDLPGKANDVNDFTEYKLQNGIADYDLRGKIMINYSKNTKFILGIGVTRHRFIPGDRRYNSNIDSSETNLVYNDDRVGTNELFGFAEWKWNPSEHWFIDAGIHHSVFVLNDAKFYSLPQPRLNIRYRWKKNNWIKGNVGVMRQFFHLLTNPTIGLPSDLWVPSTENFRPSRSDLMGLGFAKDLKMWQISTEVFYKRFYHLLEYKDNAGYLTTAQNWESATTSGQGEAWGWEAIIERTKGRLTGWLNYAWMHNNRRFDELNNGKTFPYRYDRRHNVNISLQYTLNKNIHLSAVWQFNTGFAVTLPVESYLSPTPIDPYREIFVYGDRNSFRTRNNHRLDLSISMIKIKNKYSRIWTLGLFNAYNRLNPFYLRLGFDKNGDRKLYEMSLLPIMPNISYKLSF